MLFNSLAYVVFLPLVFGAYHYLGKNLRHQNMFLLAASYFFYGCWDWRFLSLILISSATDFWVGKALGREELNPQRKQLLAVSLVVNLGLLGVFKYFNFFADSFVTLMGTVGLSVSAPFIDIILPVGISFYTFQTLSYTLDVYAKKSKPTDDWLPFFTYVAFFPQLVAGPIERASRLLPQFTTPRIFSEKKAGEGLRLILWGLFKKIVIADQLAIYVDTVYGGPAEYSGGAVALATLFFAIQIYCDFSGYSDIAIGSAKLLGIDLMTNFRMPYFAASLQEFWVRWHISLSTWFRDYVYLPLGGNRVSQWKWGRNILFTFMLSGFWHGANITFLIWGAIHGVAYLVEAMVKKSGFLRIPKAIGWATTLLVVCIAWVFFRVKNLADAEGIFSQMVHGSWAIPSFLAGIFTAEKMIAVACSLLFLFGLEFISRKSSPSQWMATRQPASRWGLYYFLILCILLLGSFENPQQFIYFQF